MHFFLLEKSCTTTLPNDLVNSKGYDWITNVSHNQQEFAQTSSILYSQMWYVQLRN